MPNLKQQAIDARLEQLLPQAVALQGSYLANYKRYFQGLATHIELPDGETKAPINLISHPGHQSHTYADFWRRVHLSAPDPETGERVEQHEYPESVLDGVRNLTVRLRFDTRTDLAGRHWTLTMDYADDTGHWAKVVGKDGVLKDWHLVEPEPAIEV